MLENIDLTKLQLSGYTQNPVKVDFVENLEDPKLIAAAYRSFFDEEPDVESIVFSNHSTKKTKIDKTYYCRITRDCIEFREKSESQKISIIFHYDSGEITKNGLAENKIFMKEFLNKLKNSGNDLNSGKALAFLEKKGE